MSGLLFGSCFGVSSSSNDDHTEDGYFQCPTVPYLLPHDVKQKHAAAAQSSSNSATTDSHNNKKNVGIINLSSNKTRSDGQNSFLLRGAQHYQRNSARRHEAASRRIVRPMLLQGSTLSKHTGSSPGGVRTEPTTDSEDEDDEDDDSDDDDDDAEQVEALVNLCVRDFDEGCIADPELELDHHHDRFRDDTAAAAAFGLTKDSSGIAALLPPHMRKKRSIPLYQELVQQQQHQQGHALWNQHPDIKFLPIHDEDGDPLPSTICVYRPKRAWPEGDVRIRWALSRNTSPTTALVLERWTAAVVLSPPPTATATATKASSSSSSSGTVEAKDEVPTRMLNLEDISYTTARLDGTVEIHDETSCMAEETNQHTSSSSMSSSGTTPPSDNRREIAWLTCYRIVFHDDHDDANKDNYNHQKAKKFGLGAKSAAAAAAGPSTLIPSTNGTVGFSARKLETRNFFSQFDDARHGPLKQYIREQEEQEAQEQQHQDQRDDSRSSSRDAYCASPNTTGSIAQSRSKSHDRSTAASSKSRGGAGVGCLGRRSKSQQYFVVQHLAVHDDYRGLGIGLCLLDDACRRICDPEAWVLVSIPPNPSDLAATLPRTKKARFRHFSFGRHSWSLSSASSIGSSKKSSRSEKREAAAAASSSSSRTVSTVPTNSNPETLMDYLGLLGFERLDGSPFCVRWNENESLPRIEEVCPHVPVFSPPPESC